MIIGPAMEILSTITRRSINKMEDSMDGVPSDAYDFPSALSSIARQFDRVIAINWWLSLPKETQKAFSKVLANHYEKPGKSAKRKRVPCADNPLYGGALDEQGLLSETIKNTQSSDMAAREQRRSIEDPVTTNAQLTDRNFRRTQAAVDRQFKTLAERSCTSHPDVTAYFEPFFFSITNAVPTSKNGGRPRRANAVLETPEVVMKARNKQKLNDFLKLFVFPLCLILA